MVNDGLFKKHVFLKEKPYMIFKFVWTENGSLMNQFDSVA